VIFIKEQNLDPETYQNFAKNIGQPVVYPRLKGLDEKFPFINVIERKPDDKNLSFGSSWLHQDCHPPPCTTGGCGCTEEV